MPLLHDGEIIRDTYEVERFLGEGGFAEVYRVKHRFLGRQAMKVLKQPGLLLKDIQETLTEALLLSKIDHPNIVRVFDANMLKTRFGRRGYFTMEYIPGGSVADLWKNRTGLFLDAETVLEIARQVCLGLALAHQEDPPIIHRDIKPQNLLIGEDHGKLRVRVSDFGLARRVNPLTLLASAQGTLGFKPPESLDNQDSCSSDVWAVGTTIYLLLTNRLPYPKLAQRSTLTASGFLTTLVPPSVLNPQVSPAIDSLLARCLAYRREDRYPHCMALLADLDRAPSPTYRKPNPVAPQQNPMAGNSPTTGQQPATKPEQDRAVSLVREALALSRKPGQLGEAARKLEQAIRLQPELAQDFEPRRQLWLKGVSM